MLKIMKGEKGFTLIEVIVALGLLGVIAAAFLTALSVSSKAVMLSDERATAENLVRSQLEYIKGQFYIPAPPDGEVTYDEIDLSEYTNYSIWSINRDGETVEDVVGVPWDSERSIGNPEGLPVSMDDGLQRIKLVIKHGDGVVFAVENYKVGH